jgi:hypothetical protein
MSTVIVLKFVKSVSDISSLTAVCTRRWIKIQLLCQSHLMREYVSKLDSARGMGGLPDSALSGSCLMTRISPKDRRLRIDVGSSFCNNESRTMCERDGVIHTSSSPNFGINGIQKLLHLVYLLEEQRRKPI